MEARGFEQASMFGNDKVLVFVHEQEGAVGDFASVVLHGEAVWRALGGVKPGLAS